MKTKVKNRIAELPEFNQVLDVSVDKSKSYPQDYIPSHEYLLSIFTPCNIPIERPEQFKNDSKNISLDSNIKDIDDYINMLKLKHILEQDIIKLRARGII